MKIYIVYGRYYNEAINLYAEKALGFYSTPENAERVRAMLEETTSDHIGSSYYVVEEDVN